MAVSIDTHLIQAIEEGAGVLVQVALKRDDGLVPVNEHVLNLCDELGKGFELDCPVKSGAETRPRNVSLDSGVEGSEYVVVLDARTRYQERITCLQGTLRF